MFSKQDRYIRRAIKTARNMQDFLWGHQNNSWDLEEWRAMLRKRISKLDAISLDNPHYKVELKKRLVQIAAVSINCLCQIDNDNIQSESGCISNLKEYRK